MNCFTFQQENLSEEIRQQIWRDYPQIRSTLMEWLFELRTWTSDAAYRAMSYAAMQCMADYASGDLAYVRSRMIPFLEQHCTALADVKYLVVFMGQFMQWESCKPMADDILCQWNRKSELLWQVPYRLYGRAEEWRFHRMVPKALKAVMEADISSDHVSGWYRQDRGYLLYPAHHSDETAALLAGQMGEGFTCAREYRSRRRWAVYFLRFSAGII